MKAAGLSCSLTYYTDCVADILDTYIVAMQDAERYLELLHSLSDMGAAMRNVIMHAITNPSTYSSLTECKFNSTPVSALYQTHSPYVRYINVPQEFETVGHNTHFGTKLEIVANFRVIYAILISHKWN